MPRTALAPTKLARDAGTAPPVATTIDATLVTNGLTLTGASQHRGRVQLIVSNTAIAAKTVTVQGGPRAGADGDLVVSVPASGSRVIVLGDTARHIQDDTDVHVDFEAGTTGTLTVYGVPR